MFDKIRRYFNQKNLKDEKYAFLFDENNGDEVVCFDCETTGLNPKKDEIISIGAVKIRDDKILLSRRFHYLVKPQNALEGENIKIHRIREVDLKHSKSIDFVIDEFLNFIGSAPVVGYFIEFDVAMINSYIKPRLGITLPNRQIEVSALYHDKKMPLIPEGNIDLRFKSIMKDLHLPQLQAHNALNDAIMSAMIYLKVK